MGASGTIAIDFGAVPGKFDASVAVASAGIGAGSLTDAWIFPVATAAHSVDEHIMIAKFLEIVPGPPVAGVGFTIYAVFDSGFGGTREVGLIGTFTIAWVWN